MDAASSSWVAIVGTALIIDIVLVKTDCRSLTCCAREHPVITTAALAVLSGHFAKRLGRFDPFLVFGLF